MVTTFLSFLVFALIIYVVETLLRIVVRRGFISDVWYMKLLLRVILAGAIFLALRVGGDIGFIPRPKIW